jgi:N-acetylated-alpha-linked acidic dipeptidase
MRVCTYRSFTRARAYCAAAAGLVFAMATVASVAPAAAEDAAAIVGFTPEGAALQRGVEQRLREIPSPASFEHHMEVITRDPHPAGSPANARVADHIAASMEAAGLEVERFTYDVYLPGLKPDVSVALVTPIRLPLNNQEYVLPEDPFSSHPDLEPGWNAFSGSGDVTAQVVYVNYGRQEDFARLASLGVSLEGKIAVARYGGNYRGLKAIYAEEMGAVGLVMYSDPANGGYVSGLPYPEGSALPSSGVQRGSLLHLAYKGDPLTPFEPALSRDRARSVQRLDPADVPFPSIPVTPLPHGSAIEILQRMTGEPVPGGWQGGLPFTYRISGGPELTLRIRVDQPKGLVTISDVVGTLRGEDFPDEWVILGSHYDAWSFGAEDPNGGTAMLLTLAESLGQLAREGQRPRRTIKIGHWDAEEFGMVGSVEWVEEHREQLKRSAVAYINADVAVSGPSFHSAAAPTLKSVIIGATHEVEHPDSSLTLYETWNPASRDKPEPSIGTLGGGSDHVGFYTHMGIPSAALSMSGRSLYHTNYDDLTYFRRFCDPQFVYGPTVARVDGIVALRLANADIIPYDVTRYATDLHQHLESLSKRAAKLNVALDLTDLEQVMPALKTAAAQCMARRDARLASGPISKRALVQLNEQLIGLERTFVHDAGLQDRPWSRSLYVGVDPFDGYGAWPLPGLRYQVETDAPEGVPIWAATYVETVVSLTQRLEQISASLD